MGRIEELPIEEEVKESYLTYAMSVIVSRALPDARDGLKPSQRRILIAMNDLNLGPTAKHRKSAKVCGDTSGNYHPHGEGVVYPTLVRLAQPWNMRYPLVDGQGNIGSIDGDPPAAMRYTESRMARPAMDLLADIDLDTVDMTRNYDDQRDEPLVLPGKFPNLLANGSSGIAVGMATSIPPHNIAELADAMIRVIDDPDVGLDELLEIIPGPDFPTGGIVYGRQGIYEAYKTGRSRITVRARIHQETLRADKEALVVTEIPYQVNKTLLIESMAEQVQAGRIAGITNIRDESDKEGMRIVIEIRRGDDPSLVLNQLYKHSQLQDTYSVIMIALVGNRPRTLSLKELILYYRDHRMEVIRRRTRFLLGKAQARAHIVEGLLKALGLIDQIIAAIRASADIPAAREALVLSFEFSQEQADAIVKMQLGRLTGLEREKLEEEHRELLGRIADYQDILAREERVLGIIRQDLQEMKATYGDPRRTEISGETVEIEDEDLIAEENMVVTITREGYGKRIPTSAYKTQGRGGKGVIGTEMKEGDFVEHLFVASTHDYILCFTDRGKVYWLKVYSVPQLSRTAKGRPMINMIQIEPNERVTSLVPVREFDERFLLMATERGYIKKTPLGEFSRPRTSGLIACTIEEGDRLIRVVRTRGNDEVLLGTKEAKAVRFHEEDVRPMGRQARGVHAVKVRGEDRVVDMVMVDDEGALLVACASGHGKRTRFEEFRTTNRNVQGVRLIGNPERNGGVVGILTVRDDDEVMLMSQEGQVVRTPASGISVQGRGAAGVILIRLDEGDPLVAIAKVAREGENGPRPVTRSMAAVPPRPEVEETPDSDEEETRAEEAEEENPEE
ncbi:MAG: DNA gyrase subunit A [Planctomycetes bacterium]|nr:DNA gyrase subunit A [Planctomycetota bacterium]